MGGEGTTSTWVAKTHSLADERPVKSPKDALSPPIEQVTAPRIKEAAIQMECKLRQIVDVSDA